MWVLGLNLDSLEEQSVLVTAEPPLQCPPLVLMWILESEYRSLCWYSKHVSYGAVSPVLRSLPALICLLVLKFQRLSDQPRQSNSFPEMKEAFPSLGCCDQTPSTKRFSLQALISLSLRSRCQHGRGLSVLSSGLL